MRRSRNYAHDDEMKSAAQPLKPYAHLTPTLFDRLRDNNPNRYTETASEISVSEKELLRIIQRDLSYLLNTVNAGNMFKKNFFPEAEKSTLNYGIPPLTGNSHIKEKWRPIEQIIRKAIIMFEPRLIPEFLSVISLSDGLPAHCYNTLLFEIRGLIRADPHPIEFLMRSSVDLETNHFVLSIP
jgi:type VI secretion system protein ImpF